MGYGQLVNAAAAIAAKEAEIEALDPESETYAEDLAELQADLATLRQQHAALAIHSRRPTAAQTRANQQASGSAARVAEFEANATKISALESELAGLDPHPADTAERSFLEGRISGLKSRQAYIRQQA